MMVMSNYISYAAPRMEGINAVFQWAKSVGARKRGSWRLLWLLVLLAHTPATVGAVTRILAPHAESGAWSSLVLLSASQLFFLVEILFAPCLKLLTDRRCAVVILLIVALLHVGVIQHGLSTGPETQFWLLLTATGFASCYLAQAVRRTLSATVGHVEACRQQAAWRYAYAAASDPAPRVPLSGWLRAPLRAPPQPNS